MSDENGPCLDVLVSDNGIVVICRCGWLNGPFMSVQKAQAWGERTHTTCEQGDLMTTTRKGSGMPGEQRD